MKVQQGRKDLLARAHQETRSHRCEGSVMIQINASHTLRGWNLGKAYNDPGATFFPMLDFDVTALCLNNSLAQVQTQTISTSMPP
jgi:hypothetical protein